MDLSAYLRSIADFPKPGISFKDISPLLANPEAYRYAVHLFCDATKASGANAVIGIESRGFLFAAPVAISLSLPLILVRKPGKLPAETTGVEYALEYGQGRLEVHKDAIQSGHKVAIIDDVLATGGTSKAAAQLAKQLGGEVSLFAFLLEIVPLQGRGVLANVAPVKAFLS